MQNSARCVLPARSVICRCHSPEQGLATFFCKSCFPVVESCLTLCNPMNCSPPSSSVHGISQARILEWVAIPFSRDLLWIFPTQGSNPGLLHWSWILYHLSHQGSPNQYSILLYPTCTSIQITQDGPLLISA